MKWDVLASLPEQDREEVLAAAARRTYNRGEILVHAGDRADSLHLIAEGRVAVEVSTSDGDRATLNILSPGDYFGELSLVGTAEAHRRTATVVALERTRTLCLDVDTFERLRARQPAFDRLLVTALAARVEQLSGRLLDVLYVGLDRRLYRCPLQLAAIYADAGTTRQADHPAHPGPGRRARRRHPAVGQPGAAEAEHPGHRPAPAGRHRDPRPCALERKAAL